MLTPVTNSQYLVEAPELGSYYFTSFSGIKDQAQTSTYADGSSSRIYQLKGPRQLQQFTLSVPFDPEQHRSVVEFWKNQPCKTVSITVTPVTCGDEPTAIGPKITITDAQLISLSFAQADRTSANVSMLELGFIANDFTYS